MSGFIKVRGAKEHNLKNIDVDIPKNQLVVITGLSGSGKSSLAFDTIYAEGQRRYVESLSAYARQFLDLMKKPDVELIEGLSPAISIEQKTSSHNPRSTVGTVTEIYDYMRLLWARVGIPYSPATGLPIESQTVSQMVDKLMAMPQGTKLHLLAPIVRGKKGEFKSQIKSLQKKGFQRLKVDGKLYDIEDFPDLSKTLKHDISVIVDRVVIKDGLEHRLADSLETALNLADGLAIAGDVETGIETLLSSKFACPVSGFTIDEIEPRLFSFNNPYGACPECDGLGARLYVDPELVVPNPDLSLSEGAFAPAFLNATSMYAQMLESICLKYGGSVTTPWKDMPQKTKDIIMFGSGGENIKLTISNGEGREYTINRPFEGVIPNMERRFLETDSDWSRWEIGRFQSTAPCETCHGAKLRPEALAVKVGGLNISEACEKSIAEAREWFASLEPTLRPEHQEIAHRILREIGERLGFLVNVGLGYLSLGRASATLSGGESQRIRLASQIGSGLTGVLYVLDEPSIGLHQRDNDKLLEALEHLKSLDNSVIVIEHDEDAIRRADYVIDMGPAAGSNGGKVVAQGTPADIIADPQSPTGQYLSGVKQIAIPKHRRKGSGEKITIKGACLNNLKHITASFPLGTLTLVTGVSGSGKSSLVLETLFAAADRALNNSKTTVAGKYDKITGLGHIDKVIDIDQSPIGRTPRSNPATYTGVFTHIREWFASLPEAKERGYTASRFSFNVKGGRCEACEGDGVKKIEMHFMADMYVTCEVCKGKRYERETLEVTYKGKSIADVLDMTVDDAYDFFQSIPKIKSKLELLRKVGLGYIKLGQSATTLSGGEAQRIKLSKELSKVATGRTLYILDEPTTGLHFADIAKLLEVLQALVDAGNTVVVIEHNLDVIKTADYIIDIGPEGGDAGGMIVATGTPEQVAKVKESHTGRYLKKVLEHKA